MQPFWSPPVPLTLSRTHFHRPVGRLASRSPADPSTPAEPRQVITRCCRLAAVPPALISRSDSDGVADFDRRDLGGVTLAGGALSLLRARSSSRIMCASCLLLPCSHASRVSSRPGAPTEASAGARPPCELPPNLGPPTLTVRGSFGRRQPSATHSVETVEISTSGWVV